MTTILLLRITSISNTRVKHQFSNTRAAINATMAGQRVVIEWTFENFLRQTFKNSDIGNTKIRQSISNHQKYQIVREEYTKYYIYIIISVQHVYGNGSTANLGLNTSDNFIAVFKFFKNLSWSFIQFICHFFLQIHRQSWELLTQISINHILTNKHDFLATTLLRFTKSYCQLHDIYDTER